MDAFGGLIPACSRSKGFREPGVCTLRMGNAAGIERSSQGGGKQGCTRCSRELVCVRQ